VSITLSLSSLLAYSDGEREKWRTWIAADPRRLTVPVQPGGRFPDIAALLDHIFLVERRHLARLEGATPPSSTGIPAGQWQPLFEYADLVRADFRVYVDALDDPDAAQTLVITGLQSSGDITMSRRRLATHIVLHEIRHLAQLALAARLAGQEPPGQHDIFYFAGFA
jgi:uncharacterized damage-inducible protein DinB